MGEIFQSWRILGYPFSRDVLRYYTGDNIVRLYQCERCSYGYFDPVILGTAEFYEQLGRMGSSWYYLKEKWEYQHALDDLSGCELILDIGCGPGFFLERCRERGLLAEGIELNPTAAAAARAKGFTLHEMSLSEFSLSHSETYDAVSMFQFLEHVRDPVSTIADALACLRPGGLLLIGLPNAKGILGYMSQLPSNVPPHHLTRWAPSTLEWLARRFSLDLVSMKFELPYRMMPAFFQEKYFSWLPKSIQRNRLWLIALYMPSRLLSILRPKGFGTLTGHTVYCVLRKQQSM